MRLNKIESKEMLISFLLPVYNVEKYLEKCVDSLLCQKGCPYEIILLDYGSTDSSGKICDRYAEEYPDIIRVIHKENEGLLLTRRRGFAEAQGDWFICVDSDDYVAPNLLETVTGVIEKTQPDMVMYNFEYVNEAGVHTPSRLKLTDGAVFEGESKETIYEKRLLSVDVNMMWMRAIKRRILDFDTDYSGLGIHNMCEDALQILPLYTNAQKIVYVDTPLYCYRKGADSITGKTTIDNWRSSQALFLHTQKYLKIWNVSEETEQRFYTQHLEYLSNYVRWLFSAEEAALPAPLPEMIAELKKEPGFVVSCQRYCRKYAGSRYLSILVSVLVPMVQRERLVGIRFLLGTEKGLLAIKEGINRLVKRRTV